MSECPQAVYERIPCPTCGAIDDTQAETMCKPTSDQSGEYSCVSENAHQDSDGHFLFQTDESVNAWVEWMIANERPNP